MAYIQSFKIAGLAGRPGITERYLDRYVNIFWGLNGTGKTSLLKVLDAAMSNDVGALDRVPFASAEVVIWSESMKAMFRRTFENGPDSADEDTDVQLEPVGDGMWQEVTYPQPRGWTTELVVDAETLLLQTDAEREPPSSALRRLQTSMQHVYLPISRMSQLGPGTTRSASQRRTVVDDRFLEEQFAEHVRRRWQAYNAAALQNIRAIQQQGLAEILAILFGGALSNGGVSTPESPVAVDGQDAYIMVKNFLQEQNISLGAGRREFLERYDNETALRDVVASIEATTVRADRALEPQSNFTATIETLYSGNKRLFLDTGHSRQGISVAVDEHLIPLQSLSSGEKQLLQLMLEVLAAEENTVMIDEPELSMHVDWQEVLVASMRKVNPDCQLILATHSPEVMADVSPSLVFQL